MGLQSTSNEALTTPADISLDELDAAFDELQGREGNESQRASGRELTLPDLVGRIDVDEHFDLEQLDAVLKGTEVITGKELGQRYRKDNDDIWDPDMLMAEEE